MSNTNRIDTRELKRVADLYAESNPAVASVLWALIATCHDPDPEAISALSAHVDRFAQLYLANLKRCIKILKRQCNS